MTNNTNNLRHKRSQANVGISLPFPTSSSTVMHGEPGTGPSRWSGESLAPADGYSTLFTSGMFPSAIQYSPSHTPPNRSPAKSPTKRSHLAPRSSYSPTTPARRRRSSIIPNTPSSASPQVFKSQRPDGGVERALDNMMRSLRMVAMGTPKKEFMYSPPRNQSRWSAWSSESEGSTSHSKAGCEEESVGAGDEGFWKPRKSSDTTRSTISRGTIKSTKSGRSKKEKGRKSEDTDRMELDLEDVPAVPAMPPVPVPTTPGRSRRMMNGLVKRLGLTPKKGKVPLPPAMPQYAPPPPPLPLPLPVPQERTIPRKSSMSTLRSVLTKKGSTTTLRSVRSTNQHPFMASSMTLNQFASDEAPPVPLPGLPRPREPTTPGRTTPGKGRRTPKSSIGQPKLQPEASPSKFLQEMPRRAPETPKRESFLLDGCQKTPDLSGGDGVIRFETEDGGDIEMADGDETVDRTEVFTPQPARTQVDSVVSRSAFEEGSRVLASPFSSFAPPAQSTPILTAKAARKAEDGSLRSKRLRDLVPSLGSPLTLGHGVQPAKGLRSGKSSESLRSAGGGPLGMRSVNAMGLPVPSPRPSVDSARSACKGKGSIKSLRRDPLGIMKRLDGRGEEEALPYRGGAGDGWSTPAVSHGKGEGSGSGRGVEVTGQKLNLGTSESYFDACTGTFGRAEGLRLQQSAFPDFSKVVAPPPSECDYEYRMESAGARAEPSLAGRFEDPHTGAGVGVDGAWRMPKTSGASTMSVSMTTGEGVEEWELERYLTDLEGDEGRRAEVL
ncbi:hypothetical protein IAT38_001724 [Cryptococcus sp. DSM 104549]